MKSVSKSSPLQNANRYLRSPFGIYFPIFFFCFSISACSKFYELRTKKTIPKTQQSTLPESILLPSNIDEKSPVREWLSGLNLEPSESVEFSDRLLSPTLEQWLSSSKNRGALRLVLRATPASASFMPALKNFLASLTKPKLMNLHLELEIPTETNIENTQLPFVNIINNFKDPLLKSTCDYIAEWIKAHQLLAGQYVSDGKKLDIECSFLLHKEPTSDVNLIVTNLALPLLSEKHQLLPFQSEADLKDEALIRNLKQSKL